MDKEQLKAEIVKQADNVAELALQGKLVGTVLLWMHAGWLVALLGCRNDRAAGDGRHA